MRGVATQCLALLQKAVQKTSQRDTNPIMQHLCDEALGEGGVPDEVLSTICKSYVTRELSYNHALQFVSFVIYRHIVTLKAPASRLLVKLLITIANQQPQAIIDRLLQPLLTAFQSAEVSSYQVDVCIRMMKEGLRADFLQSIFEGLLVARPSNSFSGSFYKTNEYQGTLVWREETMPVMQYFLSTAVSLNQVI
jgi:hypothetical protein